MNLREKLEKASPFDFYGIVEEELRKDVLQYIYNKVNKQAERIVYKAKAILIAALHYHNAKMDLKYAGATFTKESRDKTISEFIHQKLIEGGRDGEYLYVKFLEEKKEYIKENQYLITGIDLFIEYVDMPLSLKKMIIEIIDALIKDIEYCSSDEADSIITKTNLSFAKTVALKNLKDLIPDIYAETKEFIISALIIQWSLVEIGEEEYTLESKLRIIRDCLLGITINGKKNPIIQQLEKHKNLFKPGEPLFEAFSYLSIYSNNYDNPTYEMKEYVDFIVKYIVATIKDKTKNIPKTNVSSVAKVVSQLEENLDFNAEQRHKQEIEKLQSEVHIVKCVKCGKMTARHLVQCSNCGTTEFLKNKFQTKFNKKDSISKLEREINGLDMDTEDYGDGGVDENKNKKIIGIAIGVLLIIFIFV